MPERGTDAWWQMLVDEYLAGGGARNGGPRRRDVADKYGVNRGTFSSMVNRLRTDGGRATRPTGYTGERRRQAVEDYVYGGMTQRQVAERHGVSMAAVHSWVKAAAYNGIKRPDRRIGNFKVPGVPYKRALPPEQWARAERFMALVAFADREAQDRGLRVDVNGLLEAARERERKEEITCG